MKGFKDSDGKFRPISNTKGIRKKSDKNSKTTGIKTNSGIRKARMVEEDFTVFDIHGNRIGGSRIPDFEGMSEDEIFNSGIFKDPERARMFFNQMKQAEAEQMSMRKKHFPETVDEMTPSEQKQTLELLNELDSMMKDGLDPAGKNLQGELRVALRNNNVRKKRSKLQTHEEFLKEYFDTGLKVTNGWKVGRFPRYGDERIGSPQNSRSQIVVVKGKKRIRMNAVDGRLGGGYNVIVESDVAPRIDNHFKKYDEALENVHSLMRLIK